MFTNWDELNDHVLGKSDHFLVIDYHILGLTFPDSGLFHYVEPSNNKDFESIYSSKPSLSPKYRTLKWGNKTPLWKFNWFPYCALFCTKFSPSIGVTVLRDICLHHNPGHQGLICPYWDRQHPNIPESLPATFLDFCLYSPIHAKVTKFSNQLNLREKIMTFMTTCHICVKENYVFFFTKKNIYRK